MAVSLSALAGAGWQLFDANGAPLAGGKLYVYEAGTTTPATTYTSSSGGTANANPIILDGEGRITDEVWVTSSASYKFDLTDADDVEISGWPKDNIPGIQASGFAPSYVTSYAALRALTGSVTGSLAYVNAGTGIDGWFRYDASETASDNGGTIIENGSGAFVRQYDGAVNAKWFVAVGDWAIDDTATLAAARDSGATEVIIPAGTYIVTGLNLNVAGQSWRLMKGATLKLADETTANVLTISADGVELTGAGIIDGNRTNQSSTTRSGIRVSGADGVTIDISEIKACRGYGVYGSDCDNLTITRKVKVSDTALDGILVQAIAKNVGGVSIEARVDRSSEPASTIVGCGINITGDDSGTYYMLEPLVSGCRVTMPTSPTPSGAICIQLYGYVKGAVVQGNRTRGGSMGLSMDRSYDCTAGTNTFFGYSLYGVELAASQYCILSGNTCDGNNIGNNAVSISATDPDYNQIQGGVMRRHNGIPINAINADYLVIANVTIHSASAHYAINLGNCFHFAISGGTFNGAATGTKFLVLDESWFGTVSGCEVYNFTQSGILLFADSSVQFTKLVFTGIDFTTVGTPIGSSLSGGATLGNRIRATGCSNLLAAMKDIDVWDLGSDIKWGIGTSNPENTITAGVSSMLTRTDTGTAHIKETGTGNTGWDLIGTQT